MTKPDYVLATFNYTYHDGSPGIIKGKVYQVIETLSYLALDGNQQTLVVVESETSFWSFNGLLREDQFVTLDKIPVYKVVYR